MTIRPTNCPHCQKGLHKIDTPKRSGGSETALICSTHGRIRRGYKGVWK